MNDTLTLLLIDEHTGEHSVFSAAAQQAFPRVNCFFAHTCEQAIASVKNKVIPQPDFIFLDWLAWPHQPVADLQQLQGAVEMKGARIFGLTADGPVTERSWRENLGVNRIIEKQSNVNLYAVSIFKVVHDIP